MSNILFISHLNRKISQGPNYSVPAQVGAQAKYDNVFWWNLTDVAQPWWLETGVFHNIAEYPEKRISALPAPFDQPDLVVIEGFYHGNDIWVANECIRRRIPYVLVPRSALTEKGQHQKRLKKAVANFLVFNRMCRRAAAVQYLTEKEYQDSGDRWNKRHFILPNGTVPPEQYKRSFSPEAPTGVFIGRFDPRQKGLDLLMEACLRLREPLLTNHVRILLYGPERMGLRAETQKQIEEADLGEILATREGVFGEEKAKALLEGDFFVLTSRFEGMPMALVEALGYGLPCLVTEGSNMADVIREADAGWACPTSVEGICSALETMLRDLHRLPVLGENARQASLAYDWDGIARRSHGVYESLIRSLRGRD